MIKEGVVFRVWDTGDRVPGKVLYSFKFDGGGKDEWFRMGEERYSGVIESGFKIKVDGELDTKGNFQVSRAKLVAKGEPIKPQGQGGGGKSNYSGGGGNKGGSNLTKEEWAAKDLTIQYQSARRDGISMVGMLIANDVIKLPAKTKADERRAVVDALHDFYTAKFFTDVAGRAAVGRSGDELDVQDTLPAGTPDDTPATTDDGWGDDSTTEEGGDSDW